MLQWYFHNYQTALEILGSAIIVFICGVIYLEVRERFRKWLKE